MSQTVGRPREITALLNPAFCSVVIYEFVAGYQSEAGRPLDLPLVFFALPVSLHAQSRAAMQRTNVRTGVQSWLSDHPQVRLGLKTRINQTATYTREALIFGCSVGLLEIQGTRVGIGRQNLSKARALPLDDERKHIFANSRKLGRWFGRVDDARTLLISFGVTL